MNSFPELHTHSKNKIEVALDLYNNATQSYIKTAVLIHQIVLKNLI